MQQHIFYGENFLNRVILVHSSQTFGFLLSVQRPDAIPNGCFDV